MNPVMKQPEIRERSVKAIEQTAMCLICEVPLNDTGMVLTVSPPLFVHMCPKCGVKRNLAASYPRMIFR
jgi:hypothetical protein